MAAPVEGTTEWYVNKLTTEAERIVGIDRDESPFSISVFIKVLNSLYQLRMVGNYANLIFYPADVCNMLKITNMKHALSHLMTKDFVSDELREELKIKTRRRYKDGYRLDPTIKLINESGFIKLIGRVSISDPEVMAIQDQLVNLIIKIRLAENAQFEFYKESFESHVPTKHKNKTRSPFKIHIFQSTESGLLSDIIPSKHQDKELEEHYEEHYDCLYLYTDQRSCTKLPNKWKIFGYLTGCSNTLLNEIEDNDGNDYEIIPIKQLFQANVVYTTELAHLDLTNDNKFIEYIEKID